MIHTPKGLFRMGLAAVAVLVSTAFPVRLAQADPMEFFSFFAGELNRTCAEGFASKKADAREKKAYCMGFLYGVITKLERDGQACFGANIGPAIEEAAELLGNAPAKAHVWQALEDGYKKKFACQ